MASGGSKLSEIRQTSPLGQKESLELFLFVTGSVGFFQAHALSGQTESQIKKIRVNAARLETRIAELAKFGKNTQGGVDRVAFSEADIKGRGFVVSLMREAGLAVRIDEAGNIIGRKEGTDSKLLPIVFGSHIDTVPNGGKYDGALGVLAAIECSQVLGEHRFLTSHPLEVVVFSDEEGGSVGSRAMIGELAQESLASVSQSGKSVREGIRDLGGDPERLAGAARHNGEIEAYLELHIEQGCILDSKHVDIGVVEGIVGISRWEVRVEGFSNHAGTTPMNMRQDALLASSHLIIAVNRAVTSRPGNQVGTVGKIRVEPGAVDVIPGLVVMSLELRDLSADKIRALFELIQKESRSIEEKTGTKITFFPMDSSAGPALTDPRVQKCIAEAAGELGLSALLLLSGAGHDAQNMARIAPMGMIFIPRAGEISHSSREFSKPEDLARGANVLLKTILKIDRGYLQR